MKKPNRIFYAVMSALFYICIARKTLADGIPAEEVSPPVSDSVGFFSTAAAVNLLMWIIFGLGVAGIVTALCIKKTEK
ncbi:MAG: hypothetical protein IJO93_00025 [Clostridia bacterium]|nr:hypothetical protein [Clostridia bacterium]